MGNEREAILIVDDVAINRAMLKKIFEEDCDIFEAENGKVALDILRNNNSISAVVLDLLMPVLDGFGVLSEMSKDAALNKIPVLIVTGNDDDENQIKALNYGAMDIIGKPYNAVIVRTRVMNAVEKFRARQREAKDFELKFILEQHKKELEKARTDELTGLYSKQFFYTELRRILDENPDKEYVIACFDLDRFKVYNDIFGSEKGDELLSDIGKQLLPKQYKEIIASRIEADHFVALFEKKDFDGAAFLALVQQWFDNRASVFHFIVKVGCCEIDDASLDASVLCDRALLALKSVKHIGGTRVGYYDKSLRQQLLDEHELLSELSEAFDKEQFKVWFQPQYDYEKNRFFGAEALVRWQHPTRGMIPPGKFIPILEKNGGIIQMDEYVWERCCRHLREWLDKKSPEAEPIPVSVNISRVDLLRSDLSDVFVRLTKKYDIPPRLLNLEVTESAYMDNSERLIATLEQLRLMNFTIELDDFGVGYSSLNTLKDLPVDVLKLDMRFISGAMHTEKGGNILNSVIRMARWINLPVIAEGVETKQQADYLKSIGCRYMQGYYFARPMPAESFEELYLSVDKGAKMEGFDNDISQVELFWNATNQVSLVFNSFFGGAAIIECHNDKLEMLRANDRFFEMLHVTRESYEPWMIKLHERLANRFVQLYFDTLKEAENTGKEVSIETASKPLVGEKEVWLRNRIRFLSRSQGGGTVFYMEIENITARKEAEAEIKKQDVLLRALFNSVPTGILRYRIENGGELVLMSLNKALWQLFDYATESEYLARIKEKGKFSHLHPDDKEFFLSQIKKVSESPLETSIEFESRVIGSTGKAKRIINSFQKLVLDTGESFLQCVFNDITNI